MQDKIPWGAAGFEVVAGAVKLKLPNNRDIIRFVGEGGWSLSADKEWVSEDHFTVYLKITLPPFAGVGGDREGLRKEECLSW